MKPGCHNNRPILQSLVDKRKATAPALPAVVFGSLEHDEEQELLAELLYRDVFVYNDEEDYEFVYDDGEGYNNEYMYE